MKMRKRKKLTVKHKPSDKMISADETDQYVLDLNILVAKRWLEDTAEQFLATANQSRGNIHYPLEAS